MKFLYAATMLAATAVAAAPAYAAIVVNTSDVNTNYLVNFTTPNNDYLTSALSLTYLGAGATANSYKFAFSLTNTSSAYQSSLISLAFNVDKRVGGVRETGPFSISTGQTFWYEGGRDVCLQYGSKSCTYHQGGYGSDVANGGEFTLNFGRQHDSIELDDFVVKYIDALNTAPQKTNYPKYFPKPKPKTYDAIGYGTYTPVVGGVPEPSTWAMLLLGFFVVGGAMRQRRAAANRVAYN